VGGESLGAHIVSDKLGKTLATASPKGPVFYGARPIAAYYSFINPDERLCWPG